MKNIYLLKYSVKGIKALDEWIHNNCGSGVKTVNEKEKSYG